MKEYPINLYPAKPQLIDDNHSNARVIIETPSLLPWWKLWMSVGLSLCALSGAYDTAKEFLGSPEETNRSAYLGSNFSDDEYQYGSFTRDSEGQIHFRSPFPYISRSPFPHIIGSSVTDNDELRIVQMSYGSPITIDMIVGFATAFSLVGAVATGAITTVIKMLEWKEKKKKFEDENRRRDLEIELKRLELEEKKAKIEHTTVRTQPSEMSKLQEPQVVMVKKIFLYGDILAGEENVWVSSVHC